MEPTFKPKTIRCLREIINKTIRREETAEAAVPDGEPDPDRVVACCANAVLRSKECHTGSMELSGGIQADVAYLSAGETLPRSLPIYLPFAVTLEAAQLEPESEIKVCVFVRAADARIVHSRRIQARISLVLQVRAYSEYEETIFCPSDIPEAVQMKTVVYPMILPMEYAETSIHIGEELMLPGRASGDMKLLYYTVSPSLTESRVAGDKAVFQGELRLHALYQDGEEKPAVYERKIPFSQFCVLSEVYENAQADFCIVLTGCELRSNGDDTLRFDADLLVQCVVLDTVPVALCEDAYAVRGIWQPEWREYSFHNQLDRQSIGCVMSEAADLPIVSVVDVVAFCSTPEQERADDLLRLAVPVTSQILYYDTSGALQRGLLQGKPEAEIQLADGALCEANAVLGEITAQQTKTGLTVTCPLEISAECCADHTYRSISDGKLIQEEPSTEKRPAVILRRARAGEPLWELAKQYRSNVEKIARANGISGDAVPETMTVLIPM